MKTCTLLRTYIQLLDLLILSLLVLAVNFCLTDFSITDSYTSRRGMTRLMIVSWQSLVVMAGFCAVLRHIARRSR